MGTLTIRRVNDDTMNRLKSIARQHNRSTEAEVRSLVEDFTAGLLSHREVQETHFYDQLRQYMEEEGIEGIDDFELPPRDETDEPLRFE